MNEKLLDKSLYYVVGVSGGCDSMYLLDTLRRQGYHVCVAHVNYNYRHDSYIDYELVRDYCLKYQIPFYYKSVQGDYQGNFQDYARTIRYEFYLDIYRTYDLDGLILGHHLDDQLETIYMQLSHHDVVYYLGIKEVNQVKGMQVYRPLMMMYKKDILTYCQQYHVPYHDDYTNFETDFERDQVRNTILNQYNESQKQQLLELARKHNQRMEELAFKVKPYYQDYKENGYINYHLIRDDCLDIFFYLILKDCMDSQLISYRLIQEMHHQLQSPKPNIQMNLPVNYLFIKEYDNIYIIDHKKTYEYSYQFEKIQEFACPYFSLKKQGHINEGVYLSEKDFPLCIRTYQDGDKIKTSGGTKKVTRLFINAKIPTIKRKTWPIVVNKDGTIVLIPNIAKNIDYLTTKPNVFVIK